MLKLKRAYDPPASEDGLRYLVDALWPRGLTKQGLRLDGWIKEVAPSADLRRRFHHEPALWDEFRRDYARELDAKPEAWRPVLEAARKHSVTLLFGARDTEHNNAVVLLDYLRSHQHKPK